MTLHIRNARVLTLAHGPRPRRGAALGDLAIIESGDVVVMGDKVLAVGRQLKPGRVLDVIDAEGRVLMPGFVDCHTHACWAGDRLDEWEMKRRGVPYLDILKAGGGIMSTVRAVRAASEEALLHRLRERLQKMLREGTTTAEVKSGYGLSAEHELKMLRVIRSAASAPDVPTLVPTALLGHAIDPDVPDFVERTIDGALPAVHAEFPGVPVDAFCEQGAWSLADTVRLLSRAKDLGHPIRVHADQFNSLGMVREAIRLGALSVDHLEASTPDDLHALAASGTFGVILPCCGFHVDGRYANGRALVDAGGAVALATNFNPGSAPCSSVPMAIALALRHCGLSPAEAIAACTVNAATLLGLKDRGTIAPGQRADLILLKHTDERMLAHAFGGDPVEAVVLGGEVVRAPSAPRATASAPEAPPARR